MTAPPAAKPKPAAAPTPAPKQDAAGAAASRIDDVLKELINK
jgi:hypothetical protein